MRFVNRWESKVTPLNRRREQGLLILPRREVTLTVLAVKGNQERLGAEAPTAVQTNPLALGSLERPASVVLRQYAKRSHA